MSQPKIFEDKEYSHSRKEFYMDSTGQYRPRQSKSLGRPYEPTTFFASEPRQWHSAGSSYLDVSNEGLSTSTTERVHTTKTPITQRYPVITTSTTLGPKTEPKIIYHDPNFPSNPVSFPETGEVILDKSIIIDGKEEQEKVMLIEDNDNKDRTITPIIKERPLSRTSNSSYDSIGNKYQGKNDVIYKASTQKNIIQQPVQEKVIYSPSPPVVIDQRNHRVISKSSSPIGKKGRSPSVISQHPQPTQVKQTKTYAIPDNKIINHPTQVVHEVVTTPSPILKEDNCNQIKRKYSISSHRSSSLSPITIKREPSQRNIAKSVVSKICKDKFNFCDQVPRRISQVHSKVVSNVPSQKYRSPTPCQVVTQIPKEVDVKKRKSSPSPVPYKVLSQGPTKKPCQVSPQRQIITQIPSQVPSQVEYKTIKPQTPIPTQEVITTNRFEKSLNKRCKSTTPVINQERPIKIVTEHMPKQFKEPNITFTKNPIDQNNTRHFKCRSTTPVTTQIPRQTKVKTKNIPIRRMSDENQYHLKTKKPISQVSDVYEDKYTPIPQTQFDNKSYYHNKSPIRPQSPHYFTPHSVQKKEYTQIPIQTGYTRHISQQPYPSQTPAYPTQISQEVPISKSLRDNNTRHTDLPRTVDHSTDYYLQNAPKYEGTKVQERHYEPVISVPPHDGVISTIKRENITPIPSLPPKPTTEVTTPIPISSPKVIPMPDKQLVSVAEKDDLKYGMLPKGKPVYSKLKKGKLIHEIEEIEDGKLENNRVISDYNNNQTANLQNNPTPTTDGPSPISVKQPTRHNYDMYEPTKYQKMYKLYPRKELERIPLSAVGVHSYPYKPYPNTSPNDRDVRYEPYEEREKEGNLIYTTRDNVNRQIKESAPIYYSKEPTTYYSKEPSTYYTKEPSKYYTKEPTTYYTKEPTQCYRQRSSSSRKVIEEEYTRHYKKTETTDEIPREVIITPEPYYEGQVKGQSGYYRTAPETPNVGVTPHYSKKPSSRPISSDGISFENSDNDNQSPTKPYAILKQSERRPGSPERLIDEGSILSTPDGFKIILDTSQFHYNDVKITKYDHTLQIEGKHYEVEKYTNDTVTRSFVRKYSIPTDIDMDSISATTDNKGLTTIVGYYKRNTYGNDEKDVVSRL